MGGSVSRVMTTDQKTQNQTNNLGDKDNTSKTKKQTNKQSANKQAELYMYSGHDPPTTADTWNIGIYGYTAASGMTLNVEWNP